MEFKRFVSYLYTYQGNVKQHNCGFVKVEIRQNVARFVVHMYLPEKRAMEYKIYGFLRNGQVPEGILLANAGAKNGNMDVRFQMNPEQLGVGEHSQKNPVSMEQLSGIIIIGADHSRYATIWDEGEIDVQLFVEMNGTVKESEQFEERKFQEAQVKAQELPDSTLEEKKSTENPVQILEESSCDKGGFNWEMLERNCPYMAPFQHSPEQVYLRMEPKDLKYFPKELWHLGRNSFLLHGYYNYRYLIVGQMEDAVILGIPGNYYPMEEAVAAMFGFGMWFPAQRLSKENGSFGYWCKRYQK